LGNLILGECWNSILVHRSRFQPGNAVNNSGWENGGCVDLTGCFEFFTGCSQRVSGEQAVHINSLKEAKDLV
jgi:hypothetical protein